MPLLFLPSSLPIPSFILHLNNLSFLPPTKTKHHPESKPEKKEKSHPTHLPNQPSRLATTALLDLRGAGDEHGPWIFRLVCVGAVSVLDISSSFFLSCY